MIICATDIFLVITKMFFYKEQCPTEVNFGNKTQKSETVNSLFVCSLRQVTAQCGMILQVASILNWALLQSAIVGSLKSCPTLKGGSGSRWCAGGRGSPCGLIQA